MFQQHMERHTLGAKILWQSRVRIGNQLHQRHDPVLDEDRLHGLAPQAACAGCSVHELQASVNESLWQGGCGVS